LHVKRINVILRRSAPTKAAYVALGTVARLPVGAHHFGEQLNVIIGFARHLFAYAMQDFEE
jgi:hypothetical protein